MKRGLAGRYVTVSTAGGERCRAFIPNPLPPVPALQFDPDLEDKYEKALLALGNLQGISSLLPDSDLFIYYYIRKEAVLSSQIEGTQSSLDELLLYESKDPPGIPPDEVREYINYLKALDHGLERFKSGFPMSLRLMREVHGVLLEKGRGSGKDPGEFRRSQNWIGGNRPGNAVFVPPPHENVMELMGRLESFLHNKPRKTPTLIKAALTHAQFETIHPFLDGNGRAGRLLIALLLHYEGILTAPLLYLSLYFKRNRERYYELLQSVRITGDFEAWLRFFLVGVKETSDQAVATAHGLTALFEGDRDRIKALGKAANSALRVHHELQRQPIITMPLAAERTGLSLPTVSAMLNRLIELGIIRELKKVGKKRFFTYHRYLDILREGTET
jgi:Fic family protein